MLKKCYKCEEYKNIDDFYKDKSTIDGIQCCCKDCNKIKGKKYRDANKSSIKKSDNVNIDTKKCYRCNKYKLLNEFYKDSCTKDGLDNCCKICSGEQCKEYRKNNIEVHNKDSTITIKIKKCHVCKETKTINEFFRDNSTKDGLDNCCKDCNKIQHREYRKNRLLNDINFRISCNLRSRLSSAIKNNTKHGSSVRDLGCSIEYLKTYLSYKFYIHFQTSELMTWENYGDMWHIDHIIPLASFDLTNREQFLKACHYANLQPLWKEDHNRKTTHDINFIKSKKTQ